MSKDNLFSDLEATPFPLDYDDMPLCDDEECEICGELLDEFGDCPLCDVCDEEEEIDEDELEELDFDKD